MAPEHEEHISVLYLYYHIYIELYHGQAASRTREIITLVVGYNRVRVRGFKTLTLLTGFDFPDSKFYFIPRLPYFARWRFPCLGALCDVLLKSDVVANTSHLPYCEFLIGYMSTQDNYMMFKLTSSPWAKAALTSSGVIFLYSFDWTTASSCSCVVF